MGAEEWSQVAAQYGSDGAPCAGKLARTVRIGGKLGGMKFPPFIHAKQLPIDINCRFYDQSLPGVRPHDLR